MHQCRYCCNSSFACGDILSAAHCCAGAKALHTYFMSLMIAIAINKCSNKCSGHNCVATHACLGVTADKRRCEGRLGKHFAHATFAANKLAWPALL